MRMFNQVLDCLLISVLFREQNILSFTYLSEARYNMMLPSYSSESVSYTFLIIGIWSIRELMLKIAEI